MIKEAAKSRTTQDVSIGTAGGVGAGAGIYGLLKMVWPDMPAETALAIAGFIGAVGIPLISRLIAMVRTPDKKTRGQGES